MSVLIKVFMALPPLVNAEVWSHNGLRRLNAV